MNQPDIDLEVTSKLKELLGDSFDDLMVKFIHSSAEGLHSIKQAIDENNPEQLAFQGHKVKSGSAQVGAMRLSVIATELEVLGMEKSVEGAFLLYEEGVKSLDVFREALKGESDKWGSMY